MSKHKLILRADGNSKIGMGHIIRVLALAEMIKDDFDCFFATSEPNAFIINRVRELGISLLPLSPINYKFPDERNKDEETAFDLNEYLTGNEIVVTDGYWFGTRYQKKIKDKGCFLVCIDDNADLQFVADIIINHAPSVDPSSYNVLPSTRLMLGLDYLLLRSEFYRPIEFLPIEKKVFISLGGSDHFNLTLGIVNKVRNLVPDMDISIMVSDLFDPTELQLLQDHSENDKYLKIHKNLSAAELVNLIDSCTHCVIAASTVLLECYARRKKALSGYYVSNQQNIYKGMLKNGFIVGGGDLLQQDASFNNALNEYLLDSNDNMLSIEGVDKVKDRYKKIFDEIKYSVAV